MLSLVASWNETPRNGQDGVAGPLRLKAYGVHHVPAADPIHRRKGQDCFNLCAGPSGCITLDSSDQVRCTVVIHHHG